MEQVPRLTKEQGAIIGAYTGILSGNFADLHAYIECIMGRPVMTHEMACEMTASQIKEAALEDYRAILPEGTPGLADLALPDSAPLCSHRE